MGTTPSFDFQGGEILEKEGVDMDFKDEVAIVTGSGQGIGGEVAQALAKEGAQVVVADIDGHLARRTALQINGNGGEALAVEVDITSVDSIRRMLQEVRATFGEKVDILVNAAAICRQHTDIFSIQEKDWDDTLQVNLKGLFFCCQLVAREMIKQRRGKIVNIASTSAFIPSTTCMLPYDASKAGVKMLTTGMAELLAPYQINVNAIAPGTTKTRMVLDIFGEEYWEGDWVSTRYPLGRIAEPFHQVQAVLFLCSKEASYITGHTLVVDGGFLLAYRETHGSE